MAMYKTYRKKYFQTLLIAIFFIYGPAITAQTANTNPKDLISGGIVLHADSHGHYRGTVLINNHPFPFMIDTGATNVAIPKHMASTAQLPFGASVQLNTANGIANGYSTRIPSLKIGAAHISNLEATIAPDLDEVLIGMNALKYFRMTQGLKTLTLIALNPDELAEVGGAVALPSKPLQESKPHSTMTPKTTWEKTVTCDNDGLNCKTSYK
jgi:aspartyl protease family protein